MSDYYYPMPITDPAQQYGNFLNVPSELGGTFPIGGLHPTTTGSYIPISQSGQWITMQPQSIYQPPQIVYEQITSVFQLIYRVVIKQANLRNVAVMWTQTTAPEDLDICLSISLSRQGETFELDFGRIVAMLEKQSTVDLDFTEVERYIAVTCAMLPQIKTEPSYVHETVAKMNALAQSMTQTKAIAAQNAFQRILGSGLGNAIGGMLGK